MKRVVLSRKDEGIAILQNRLSADGYLFFPEFGPAEELSAFFVQFGRLRPQDDGQPFYTVKAGAVLQPSDGGALMPHTDEFNSPKLPPRLIALYCINPGAGKGGETLIADGYNWLEGQAQTIELLERKWPYKRENALIDLPFLTAMPNGARILRVSFGHLQYQQSEPMVQVMEGLKCWFFKTAMPVQYQRGSLLLWHNWRIIHGRNAYTDLNRELRRYHFD